MTSRTGTMSSRPLVHQRQISHLALPPLLIPAQQPTPRAATPPPRASSPSPAPARRSNTPISQRTPPPTSSFSRSSPRQPIAQKGSLIAFLQQHHLQPHQARTYSSSSSMASDQQIPEIITRTREAASGIPGEQVEPRQTLPSEDMEPNPANSIPLPPNRQKLVDDIVALYSCQPSIERVARYAPGQSSRVPPTLGAFWPKLTLLSMCLRRSVRLREWLVTAACRCLVSSLTDSPQTDTRWLASGMAWRSCSPSPSASATRSSRMTTP